MSSMERAALRFLLKHLVVGTVGAAVLGTLILVTDFGSIRSLALRAEGGWLFILMLYFGLFVTFGAVAMAAGVMSLGKDEN